MYCEAGVKMKIAIVEDQKEYADLLEKYIKKFSEENGVPVEVDQFQDAIDIADEYNPVYDLICLDIKMKHMDGMQAARKIRERDTQVIIIFITSMAQFAVKGYEVDAMDYIVKPISYYAFAMKMKKAVRIYREKQEQFLFLPYTGGMKRIFVSRITYLEIVIHRITVHTLDGEFQCTGSLSTYEKQLPAEQFVRCNSCYLVNLRYVEEITKNDVIVDGKPLKISRPKRKDFLEALAKYYGGSFK